MVGTIKMKKIIISIFAVFSFTCIASAQTTEDKTVNKKEIPQKVDRNLKELRKNTSKVENLTHREDEEIKTEEQAKPNPMKSKIDEKALNPQPFPPADKVTKKLKNTKTTNN